MRKLPLSFTKFSLEPGNLMRNYHSLKIERPVILDFEIVDGIEDHLQSLNISQTTLKNSEIFKAFFEKLKLLNILVLSRIQIDVDKEATEVIKLPPVKERHLKKLEMTQVDHRLLSLIPVFQVLELEIIDGNNNGDSEAMTNFLQSQNKLKSLTIENLSDAPSAIFEAGRKLEINFKLTKLSVLFSNIRNVDKFDENFISFLRTQATSLKKLKVEGSLSPNVYKFIVKTCETLEELEININELPQEHSFYNFIIGTNVVLKTLRLNGTITRSNLIGFKGILTHYQSVRGISLADTDSFVANDVFQLLSTIPRKLNDLSVLNLHGSFTANVVFPALTHFSIKILHSIEQWIAFISRNESLEMLSVGWIKRDQFTPQVIREITELPNLHHLKFGGRFIACKRIYEVIKRDYKNLRTLELMVANYEEIKNIRFVFPSNKSLWLPLCLYFDEGSDREPLND